MLFAIRTFARILLAHIGHFEPFVRRATAACHSCPSEHFHQIFLLLPLVTSLGVSFPFFVGCHSWAISGYTVYKSLNPINTLCPEQYGHPRLFVL